MSIESGFLLTFAMEETLKKVGSIAIDEVSRIYGIKKDLEKLRNTTESVQALLREAEDKQKVDDRVKAWLVKLQDLVYDADDVLDEFSYENLRRKIEIGDQLKRKLCNYLIWGYNPFSFRREIANKVKEINKTFADIEKQATSELALKAAVGADRGGATVARDQLGSHPLLDESKPPVGRTEELKKINDFLEGESSSHDIKFVCITGFGGLGKTTLAKMVYAEAKRKNLFDAITWIDVSETSTAIKILGIILKRVDPNSNESSNTATIVERLQEKLEQKTFLLVLDNVWNKEHTDWLNLEESLSVISKKNGNAVIMTTRITELANVMRTSCRYLLDLNVLSEDECWSIIKGKVFGKGEESLEDDDLEKIGLDIAKKCRGVPLVANVVGGMLALRPKRDMKDWESLRDSNVWRDIKENNILPILRLSFYRLSSPLKQCFAYCSLFRKNFVFEREQLIQLWMAEGFLHEVSENASTRESSMEGVGDRYFHVLLGNSFFQNVEADKWGNIVRCKMHDLIHDLAMSVSSKQQRDGSSSSTFKTHDCQRMSFFVDYGHATVDCTRDELRKLRSLHSDKAIFHTWYDFKSLRSLNLFGADYRELPSAIGVLKHLRYLDISNNYSIQELPDSITKLYNLQTLRVINCWFLKELPRNIGILMSLRHIHFNRLQLVPFIVGSLTNLRTLPLFVVQPTIGYEIKELKDLNELRGKLKIYNLEQVGNGTEALAVNLKGKKLSKLRLEWSSENWNHQEVLEGLQPPESIKSLTIKSYKGKLFPKWMCMKVCSNSGIQSPLTKLVKLKLLYCSECEKLPTLGHLPSLKILEIQGMSNLRSIGSEFYGESKANAKLFPVLEKLNLWGLVSLEEWEAPHKQTNLAFPFLQELVIAHCSVLKRFPSSYHFSSLKSMNIESCRGLISLPIGSTSLEDLSIKYCEQLESISSSQDLVSLKFLVIVSCWRLTSLSIRSTSLEDLFISECENLESISSAQDFVSLKRIPIYRCKKLTSFPNSSKSLEDLRIDDCSELEFISSSQDLVSLKRIDISSCYNLTSLPTFSKSLESLKITYCEELKSISSSEDLVSLNSMTINNCPQLTFLPEGLLSLQRLHIESCDNLESISSTQGLISLNVMCISECRKLTLFSTGSKLLKSLRISIIRNLSAKAFSGLSSLETLEISNMNLILIPSVEDLTSLETLEIGFCEKLASLPEGLHLLKRLKSLEVHGCTGLISIETDIIGSITQLETLKLGPFSYELVEFPGFDESRTVSNPSLQVLSLHGNYKMKSLPYLGHLTALKELTVRDFGISELPLWIGNLSSLEKLVIWECGSLISLPTTLQQLSKLTTLYIRRSPLLRTKFNKDPSSLPPIISKIAEFD